MQLDKFHFLTCKMRMLYFLLKVIAHTGWLSSQPVESTSCGRRTRLWVGLGEGMEDNQKRLHCGGQLRAEWVGFTEGVSARRNSMSKSPEWRNTVACRKLQVVQYAFSMGFIFPQASSVTSISFVSPLPLNTITTNKQKLRNSLVQGCSLLHFLV